MIYGISVVRNEADVIAINLQHHLLNEGFDRILIADNESSDGTVDSILSLKNPNIILSHAPGQYKQSEIVTALAREAHLRGATWIVPFDADEFWHAEGGIAATLNGTHSDDSLEVEVVNYVQSRSIFEPTPRSLLGVRYRPVGPFCLYEDAEANVIGDRRSFVEVPYPAKYIARSSSCIEISPGNHSPQSGTRVVPSSAIRCLHIPLRSKAALQRKADQSRRLDEAGFPPQHGWHLRRFAAVIEREGDDTEWRANSSERGILHARRGPVAMTYDPIIPTLLRPIVAPSLPERAGSTVRRLLRRWVGSR